MKCIFNQFILSGIEVKRPDVITEYLVPILKLDEGNPGFAKKKVVFTVYKKILSTAQLYTKKD